MLTHFQGSAARRVALVAAVVCFARAAGAQSTLDSDTANPGWSEHVAVWGSAGLGTGNTQTPNGGGVASVVRGSVSFGPWLLSYRNSDIGPFIAAGSGVRDSGILAGMRTGGHRLFASGALGYVRASPYHQSDNSSYPTVAMGVGALAYDVSLHANAYVPGIALSLSGDIGPPAVTCMAVTLSLELGWFGQ